MDKKKYTLLGGDRRNIQLAHQLIEDGNEVKVFGFDKIELCLSTTEKLYEAIIDSDVIIGPLPFSVEKKLLNTPFHSKEVQLSEVLNLLSKKQIFTAGKIDEEFQLKAKEESLTSVDYFAREEMQVLNAIPTAEGAIQIAMEQLDTTIHGSNVIVLGYGRIGKVLSKMLYGIGASVYVEARSCEDIAWIKNNGFIPVPLKELQYYLPKMDVVFNTIPELILDESMLSKICKNCLLIELASKPGGVDLEAAKTMEIKLISAMALPGKVAPITAAKVIKDTIYNIINELEE